MKKLRILLALALCVAVFGAQAGQAFWPFASATASANKAGIDLNQYPQSDDKEWGQLLWNIKLANQPLDDFSNFTEKDEVGASANRYTLAYGTYFVAAEQYHKVPAWSEALQPVIDRLIMKMQQKKIWSYWSDESTGIPIYQPNMDKTFPAAADPVGHANIMYSGHLTAMIGLYQMLYNDRKWDKPGSIVFKWDDTTQFVYDNKKLQEIIALQYLNNPVPGVECERNAIFAACQLFPILGFKLYDQQHGTRYYDACYPLYMKWIEKDWLDPKTGNIAWFYTIKQKSYFSATHPYFGNKADAEQRTLVEKGVDFMSASQDGGMCSFLHPMNPALIEKIYPMLKKEACVTDAKGDVTLKKDAFLYDDKYGYFSCAAAEMGDEAMKKALYATMEKIFKPVWIDGTFHYPYYEKSSDKNAAKPSCCPDQMRMPQTQSSDKMIALSRALPKSGLWTLFNKPFDDQHFAEPAIKGVDLNRTALSRAMYDRSKQALIISLRPGIIQEQNSFKIINLDPTKTYLLYNNIYKVDANGKATVTDNDPLTVANCSEYEVTVCGKMTHDIILKQK